MTQIREADVRLPRPPGVFRRALVAHPLAVDVFIVVWYLIGCGIGLFLDTILASGGGEEWFGTPGYAAWPWWTLAILRMLAVAWALLKRRSYPLSGLVITVLALIGGTGMQGFANAVAVVFLLYAVPVYRSVAAGWLGYGIAVAVATALNLLEAAGVFSSGGSTGPDGLLVAESGDPRFSMGLAVTASVMTAVWYLAVVLVGINLGNRRRYVASIIERAHQLARERDQLAQLAVAEERSRIAREMHDIVAHSVSVMIALSEGAARASETAPEAAQEAMRRAAETGRSALGEMRRLLGALNDPGDRAELAPQPGVEDLPELARSFRDAGLDVALAIEGEAYGDLGQELAVYRVIQEALTNVLRHAGAGARAEVRVERSAERIVIEVRDHGSPFGTAPLAGVGSGRGLAGLAERARVFGGSIDFGPVPVAEGGGWRVRVALPVMAGANGGETVHRTKEEKR